MPWAEPGTSSPSGSAKTAQLGGQCGSCSGHGALSPAGWFRVRTRQRPSTGITSSGRSRWLTCHPTGCWPCSEARERRYWRSISHRPSRRRWRSWRGFSSKGKPRPRNRCGWRFRTVTSGCWNPPSKRRFAKKLEFALKTRPSKYSPTTSESCFWPRSWDRRTSWRWTPDSAPAANWYAWTARAGCCITILCIPCWADGERRRQPRS